MEKLSNTFHKKPTENKTDEQLFAFDVNINGAKNFVFNSYINIYDIIKNPNYNSHFHEDNTFAKSIKLYIDIDEDKKFNNELERDKYANFILGNILSKLSIKIYQSFKINDTPSIILISDTLNKLSLHIIYPNIVFNNVYEMKYFINDIDYIDQAVYRVGCFRMMYCSKFGKDNKLIYFDSRNYKKPNDDYLLFLDACICYTNNKKPLEYKIKEINVKPSNKKIIERNYKYINVDFNKIEKALDKLKENSNEYIKWLSISFCLKDLYLGVDDKNKVYELYENFSKTSSKYNKCKNKKIFMDLEPMNDINYLFKLADMNYYILPFYDYQSFIFNPDNHANIIKVDETYIDISNNIDEILKHKFIFVKSPTGTGKTTNLKLLIDKLNKDNIISITSRVNLAGEHMKDLNLEFYKVVEDFKKENKLVIQLESLTKCYYKLFKNGVLILDEINSILSHLRSPTLDKKRKEVYAYLIEIIKSVDYVIGLDADLSDWNIKFLKEIDNSSYIIYYNTIMNKNDTTAIYYECPQIIIDIMEQYIKNNNYFVACFDSLTQMTNIINYLSKFGDKKEWLIYSSKENYGLIDTTLWADKFVFYSPSIIYGIDFNDKAVDIFCFVYKNHLNPLNIYQMISRPRKQNKVHVYCMQKEFHLKYKSVEDVIKETELYEKNFGVLLPNYENYIDIDDKAYRIMYYNYKFMDSILKTNIKEYLIDLMKNKGYTIEYNNDIKGTNVDIKLKTKMEIRDRIVSLLNIDRAKMNDFEKRLTSDDKFLEKHFNLRIYLNGDIDDKICKSIVNNLYIETIKNKYTKIKICKELMKVLNINELSNMTKELTKNFSQMIENKWLDENISIIKKTFEIRTKKYDTFTYYNIYILLITILKNLFDGELFISKFIKINNIQFTWYLLDINILNQHKSIIKKLNEIVDFID
jgi:hypothetical protein